MALTPDARSPSALQGAVNDSAGRAAALWTTFITLEAYLLVATGSVKHRDLFLDASIKLPILGVDLPVTGYFFVAPLVLLIFHFYLLLQLNTLSVKVREYSFVLREQVQFESDRRLAAYRLIDFPFLQYLSNMFERRSDRSGPLPTLISWLTIVLFPLAILLQFQLAFLPYHDQWITWSHRFCIALDIALVWVFWLRIHAMPEVDGKDPRMFAVSVAAASILLCFSWFIAAYPGEWVYRTSAASTIDRLARTIARFLFEGEVDGASGRPSSLFANRIILPGERIFDVEKHTKTEISVSLRGRDLRSAVLQRADLRKADFTGANLQDASFVGASLQGARFACAPKVDVDPEARLQSRARAIGCDRERATDLRFADFTEAAMQGAVLDNAKLHGARLTGAKAQGASFNGANLTAALMGDAHLEGASLVRAKLLGAYLLNTQLQGADLERANFEAANLFSAQLHGANIKKADFAAAFMKSTNLYRAYGNSRDGMEELCNSAICEPLLASAEVPKGFRTGNVPLPPGGYDDAEEIKTLDARGYRLLLARAVEGVESDRIKKLITTRLASLDPAKVVNDEKQVTISAPISTDGKLVGGLKVARSEAACRAMCEGADAPLVVRSMIYNGRIYNLSNGGLELITFLRSRECAGTRRLGAAYLRSLDYEEARIGRFRQAEDVARKPLQCKRVASKDEDEEAE